VRTNVWEYALERDTKCVNCKIVRSALTRVS
jgi:hypothetical protein